MLVASFVAVILIIILYALYHCFFTRDDEEQGIIQIATPRIIPEVQPVITTQSTQDENPTQIIEKCPDNLQNQNHT